MYKVKEAFYDADKYLLMTPGEEIDWSDKKRIKEYSERGLIEEVKEPEPKKKAPAKKKTVTQK